MPEPCLACRCTARHLEAQPPARADQRWNTPNREPPSAIWTGGTSMRYTYLRARSAGCAVRRASSKAPKALDVVAKDSEPWRACNRAAGAQRSVLADTDGGMRGVTCRVAASCSDMSSRGGTSATHTRGTWEACCPKAPGGQTHHRRRPSFRVLAYPSKVLRSSSWTFGPFEIGGNFASPLGGILGPKAAHRRRSPAISEPPCHCRAAL